MAFANSIHYVITTSCLDEGHCFFICVLCILLPLQLIILCFYKSLVLYVDVTSCFPNSRFIYGKPDVPKASHNITSQVYAELENHQINEDWDAAVKLVVEAGVPNAPSFPTNNWYRLRRSLEIVKVCFF